MAIAAPFAHVFFATWVVIFEMLSSQSDMRACCSGGSCASFRFRRSIGHRVPCLKKLSAVECVAIFGDHVAFLLGVRRCTQVALFAASTSILSSEFEGVFAALSRSPYPFFAFM